MKQISYILYTSLAVLSFSCSQKEIEEVVSNAEGEITFAQMQTKSSLLGSSDVLTSLDVIAYKTDPSNPALTDDDVVMYIGKSSLSLGSDKLWGYSPSQFWPKSDEAQELTFLAMSPSMPLADNPDLLLEMLQLEEEYDQYYEDLRNYNNYIANPDAWVGEIPTKPIEPILLPIGNLSDSGLAYLPSEDNNYFSLIGEAQGNLGITSDDFLAAFYKLPTDVANHPDLMFSSAADNYSAVSASASKSVNLEFHHALTAVSFSVIGKPTQKITSITINNIATSGSVMYFPEIDLSIFDSSDSGIQKNFFLWLATDEMGNVDATIIKDVVPNRDNPTSLTPEGSILMLIPSNDYWDTSLATITVEYTDEGNPLTQQLKFPSNHEWIPGVHNNYKITLPQGLGPMTISVSAIPWNNEDRDITTDSWGPDQGGGGGEEGEIPI